MHSPSQIPTPWRYLFAVSLPVLTNSLLSPLQTPSWSSQVLGKSMVELTGDYTPDLRALLAADIIIATPEKWDGISRQWQSRAYAKKVYK